MSKNLLTCLVTFILIVTCTGCKARESYKVSSYLNELAYQSGISLERNAEESFNELSKWNIVKENEKELLDTELTYKYLGTTLSRFFNNEDGIDYLKDNNYIKKNIQSNDYVDEEDAIKIITKVVKKINNPEYENKYYVDEKEEVNHLEDYSLLNNYLVTNKELKIGDLIYLENDNKYKKVIDIKNDQYILSNPSINEVLNELDIEGSEYIDFDEVEVVPIQEDVSLTFNETNYVNSEFTLLASKRKSFSKDGFDISYSIKSSGLDIRISKKLKKGPNMFFDIDLSNIKPTYKWDYKDGKLNEAFFKVDFKLTNEIGVSTGKYGNYYLDLKDKDSSTFLHFVKNKINSKDDEIEATIPICTIKTPIPNVPTATLNISVLAKVYVSGKIEIVFYNSGTLGFETKNGNFRIVHDIDKDTDFQIGASARAVVGLNFSLASTEYKLMDIEFDGGIRTAISSKIHLYDEEGNNKEVESDVPYSILEELSKENKDIRICGDISFNWILDILFNTSGTLLNKFGLSYKKTILDKSNQVFGNKTHIENFQLVDKCTRKSRFKTTSTSTTKANSNKISLKKYSQVIIKGESFDIPIVSLPNGYNESDLIYSSYDTNIATCTNGTIHALEIGSTSIEIKTSDGKYKANINVLVSTG